MDNICFERVKITNLDTGSESIGFHFKYDPYECDEYVVFNDANINRIEPFFNDDLKMLEYIINNYMSEDLGEEIFNEELSVQFGEKLYEYKDIEFIFS